MQRPYATLRDPIPHLVTPTLRTHTHMVHDHPSEPTHMAGGALSARLRAERLQPALFHIWQVVLSPHVYGPSVSNQPYFASQSFPDNM